MPRSALSHTDIADIFSHVHTIAILGASPTDNRPSHGVMGFLLGKGYHCIPVNPLHAGEVILGQRVVASLADIADPIDMIDVFRKPEAFSAVIDEVLALSPLPRIVWAQKGVGNDDDAARAEAVGITVVLDRCPVSEFPWIWQAARARRSA
ncbi:hypothetical protein SAMN05880582_101176 [Rhizobium sp. RU20A]|uniref:CoA-binding protein n=1 Tax=Rhizobium sp. RU20A TaxID=1907412 RepID=UPI000955F13B|nr:CoA-binding protein [Rhizobium sp. RU20A]SIP96101.1 hypothetical protein SAMN05880582_101176 [Rhizobium sp. RU20A]